MKKVMFVLVSLLIVSTFAFALESGPSNKVGYVKINALGGTGVVYTQFGLPFKFWYVPTGNVPTYGTESRKPSSIVGSQANCGTIVTADKITRQDNGHYAYRNSGSSCAWVNPLETNSEMEPGRAYWYQNNTHANRNLVLAGEADTTAAGIPTVTIAANSNTPYSWRDPRELANNKLNLLAQGFTGGTVISSDRVISQASAGTSFYYRTSDGTWQGLATVSPGTSYWVKNNHATPWNYTYNATGVPIIVPGNNGPAQLQKISAPVNVPTAKTSSRTASK